MDFQLKLFVLRIKSEIKHETLTHGIVHAGFSGMRAFLARKKSRCKLIGNRFVLPHDTIPSSVTVHFELKKEATLIDNSTSIKKNKL
jgi:hypothetical protein